MFSQKFVEWNNQFDHPYKTDDMKAAEGILLTVPDVSIDFCGSAAPFVAEGTLSGNNFYFRHRNSTASLDVAYGDGNAVNDFRLRASVITDKEGYGTGFASLAEWAECFVDLYRELKPMRWWLNWEMAEEREYESATSNVVSRSTWMIQEEGAEPFTHVTTPSNKTILVGTTFWAESIEEAKQRFEGNAGRRLHHFDFTCGQNVTGHVYASTLSEAKQILEADEIVGAEFEQNEEPHDLIPEI